MYLCKYMYAMIAQFAYNILKVFLFPYTCEREDFKKKPILIFSSKRSHPTGTSQCDTRGSKFKNRIFN